MSTYGLNNQKNTGKNSNLEVDEVVGPHTTYVVGPQGGLVFDPPELMFPLGKGSHGSSLRIIPCLPCCRAGLGCAAWLNASPGSRLKKTQEIYTNLRM